MGPGYVTFYAKFVRFPKTLNWGPAHTSYSSFQSESDFLITSGEVH